jgi:hypothetical protein
MATNLTSPPARTGGSRGPRFVKSQSSTSVRVSPGKGGHNLGTPRHCTSQRAASNLKGIYRY